MQTPIKFTPPYRSKYLLDETYLTNDWFIFGQYPDGTVGICDGNQDIFTHVPKDIAERIVAARHTFCHALLGIINEGTCFDDRFDFETGLPKVEHVSTLFLDASASSWVQITESVPEDQPISVRELTSQGKVSINDLLVLHKWQRLRLFRLGGDRLGDLMVKRWSKE